jgi:hypothetical protein
MSKLGLGAPSRGRRSASSIPFRCANRAGADHLWLSPARASGRVRRRCRIPVRDNSDRRRRSIADHGANRSGGFPSAVRCSALLLAGDRGDRPCNSDHQSRTRVSDRMDRRTGARGDRAQGGDREVGELKRNEEAASDNDFKDRGRRKEALPTPQVPRSKTISCHKT